MAEFFSTLTQLLLAALGVVAAPDASMLGLAVAVIAMAVLALTVAHGAVRAGKSSPPHPLRAIDVSTLLGQSDPDAAGHPRPRAPGAATAA